MRRSLTPKEGKGLIYVLKATLLGIEPPIWRIIHVPGHYTLYALHRTLQIAMGWEEGHLHDFQIGDIRCSTPYEDAENLNDIRGDSVTLGQAAGISNRFEYRYDFGDGWRHEILIQKIVKPEPSVQYPICTGGSASLPAGGLRRNFRL